MPLDLEACAMGSCGLNQAHVAQTGIIVFSNLSVVVQVPENAQPELAGQKEVPWPKGIFHAEPAGSDAKCAAEICHHAAVPLL
jgi:hypothetical protein